MADFDLVLVGGGLQNGLIALAVAQRKPGLRVALIEKDARLGGNHTWSFHEGDVQDDMRSVVDPLVEYRWPSYVVRFPGVERKLDLAYASFTSESLHTQVVEVCNERPGFSLQLGCAATSVTPEAVCLADGRCITGRWIVDARGPSVPELAAPAESGLPTSGDPAQAAAEASLGAGFQKFVGLEIELENDVPLALPVVMDATVPQTDGFRFIYSLPFGPRRLLVEDTYFSDTPDLDVPRLRYEVLAYALERGLRVRNVLRQETGVLPMPLSNARTIPAGGRARSGPRRARGTNDPRGPLRLGYGGGWFHPATGYSFPVALRLARHLATAPIDDILGPDFDRLEREHQRQTRFFHLLNRLLFLGIVPSQRWSAMARFYSLPDDVIRRFYALTLTTMDRTRILVGRPPRGMSLRGMWAAVEAR